MKQISLLCKQWHKMQNAIRNTQFIEEILHKLTTSYTGNSYAFIEKYWKTSMCHFEKIELHVIIPAKTIYYRVKELTQFNPYSIEVSCILRLYTWGTVQCLINLRKLRMQYIWFHGSEMVLKRSQIFELWMIARE